jgi:hypothetical protein
MSSVYRFQYQAAAPFVPMGGPGRRVGFAFAGMDRNENPLHGIPFSEDSAGSINGVR